MALAAEQELLESPLPLPVRRIDQVASVSHMTTIQQAIVSPFITPSGNAVPPYNNMSDAFIFDYLLCRFG